MRQAGACVPVPGFPLAAKSTTPHLSRYSPEAPARAIRGSFPGVDLTSLSKILQLLYSSAFKDTLPHCQPVLCYDSITFHARYANFFLSVVTSRPTFSESCHRFPILHKLRNTPIYLQDPRGDPPINHIVFEKETIL